MDTRPDTMSNIASYYNVKSKTLQRHYKYKVSGFQQWPQKSHAGDYLIYPENITENLSIDEVNLSKGELYTFITNKNTGIKNKGSVVAVINGTDSKTIQEVLEKIHLSKRNEVKEVSMDMARNMSSAVKNSFLNSKMVIDRFHVVRLVLDAMQHIRVNLRWAALKEENWLLNKLKRTNRNICRRSYLMEIHQENYWQEASIYYTNSRKIGRLHKPGERLYSLKDIHY